MLMIKKIIIEKLNGKFKLDIVNHDSQDINENSIINERTLKEIIKILESKKKKNNFLTNKIFQDSRTEKSNYRKLTRYNSSDNIN